MFSLAIFFPLCLIQVLCPFFDWAVFLLMGFKSPITSWEIDGETVETVSDFISGGPKSLQMVIAAMKLKGAYSL